jgi:4'-phosphopantetheinyl transferase
MNTPFGTHDYSGPPDGSCDVWCAAISSQRPWHDELLNDVETERAGRYQRPEDRARFVVGVALTRALVGAALGIDPVAVALDRICPQCGQPHGRPVVLNSAQGTPALSLSISHSGEWVVLAIAWGIGVGADIEQVAERTDNEALAARFFTEQEQNAIAAYPVWADGFYRLWTAKDSAL